MRLLLYKHKSVMKRILFMIILGLGGLMPVNRTLAQRAVDLFQAYSWEQASLQAARENKLVLVEVGPIDPKVERGIQTKPDLVNYLQRNVIAIRLNANDTKNSGFQTHLLMYEPPLFAFFMPYGDLLEMIKPEEVLQDPSALRETLEKAKERAAVKKRNSRSVRFEDLPFEEALAKAEEAEQPVCIYFTADRCQACLLLEKNVLNLDEVADYYNDHFVNLRVNTSRTQELARRYGIKQCPAFLFLNAKGKVIYQDEGAETKEQLLDNAALALKKAGGISFQELSDEEARAKVQQENKPVFIDYYIPGGAHKEMLRTVFADPEVAALFEQQFVNVARESGQAVLVFTDAGGNELHRVRNIMSPEDLLQEARMVLEGKGLAGMEKEFRQGSRRPEFLKSYMAMLGRADRYREAGEIAAVYFSALPSDCLREAEYWDIFDRYYMLADTDLFQYVLTHRKELYDLYGEDKVRKKIAAVWIAGAENFVQDGVFDEAGFKAYTKRLKKEKVEEWRQIVRNARMHAAECTGDWRTFVDLAEEKWYEEKIPDAELYSWGVKINENCPDEAIRYKAAHWFVQAAQEMERKERVTGKVSMSSYKGFFEKLADDLVGKK